MFPAAVGVSDTSGSKLFTRSAFISPNAPSPYRRVESDLQTEGTGLNVLNATNPQSDW